MLQQVIIKIKRGEGVREKSRESSETQNGSITSNKFYANIANQNRNKNMFEKKNKSANYEKKRGFGGFVGSVVTLCGTNILNIKWNF